MEISAMDRCTTETLPALNKYIRIRRQHISTKSTWDKTTDINRVQFLPRTDADQNVFGNFNISIYPDDGTGNPAATPSFSQNYNTNYFGDSFATLDPG